MQSRHVCVPINSPAWRHYHSQGWITLRTEGSWVFMTYPDAPAVG